ncbi:hypothetical protein PybrP1_006123, partial [[Pythium] brassicae (nom. inval.)]
APLQESSLDSSALEELLEYVFRVNRPRGDAKLLTACLTGLQRCAERQRETMAAVAIWTADALTALRRRISRLQEPSERQATLKFGFQVVRHALKAQALRKQGVKATLSQESDLVVQMCMDVMLLGVTDVWSAIRKDCVQQTPELVFLLPSLDAIEAFVDRLLRVAAGTECIGQEKSHLTRWGEQDGALRTLSFILGSICVEKRASEEPTCGPAEASARSRVASDIKGGFAGAVDPGVHFRFGDRHPSISRLPRALVRSLKPVLYQCLRHEQLSVREIAAQCLKHHVDLSEEPMRLLVFQEVMSKLNRMKDSDGDSAAVDHELLEAYEAEGLLDVLAKLTPSLPPLFLLKHWKFVFPTLERYVMHIASSVRQKSSAVVLALARLNQVAPERAEALSGGRSSSPPAAANAALELLSEMMLALSEFVGGTGDVSSCCWQQREGRLLSIEALVNLLGKDLMFFTVGVSALHRVADEPRQSTQALAADPEDHFWACTRAAVATWTVGDAELKALTLLARAADQSDENRAPHQPLIGALNAFLDAKVTTEGSERASGFWRRVLHGWLHQTRLAFASNQFELHRISRQMLPALLRLSLWTNELELLLLCEAKSDDDDGWRWSCVKAVLLHLQFLSQSIEAKRIPDDNKLIRMLESGVDAVWRLLRDAAASGAPLQAGGVPSNPESAVVRAEAQAMGFLSFYTSHSKLAQAYELIKQSLDIVHSNLPAQLQLEQAGGAARSRANASSDRQLSISLVGMLPALVRALASVAQHRTDARMAVDPEKRSKSWLILERAALAWLTADDMFRWITVDQNAAHASLLRTLSQLLRCVPAGVDADSENLLLLMHLEAWASAKVTHSRGDDATLTQLLDIHLAAWRASYTTGAARLQISAAIVRSYSQLVSLSNCLESKAAAAAAGAACCSEQSSWDDWDGED